MLSVLLPSFLTITPATHQLAANPTQNNPTLSERPIARMPADSEIVSAMDADADGAKLNEVVRQAFELSGRQDLRFSVHEPFGFKDWNDQLRFSPSGPRPTAASVPTP
jgi:hypothetical protein